MIKEVLLIIAGLAVTEAVLCRKLTCLSFTCGTTTCPPGFVVRVGGGFCGCCNNCVQALKEGEKCNPERLPGGYYMHKGVTNSDPLCGNGLTCDLDSKKCIKEPKN